jgi:DNA polymerase III alpha subunit
MTSTILAGVLVLFVSLFPSLLIAANLLEITELISHPEQYDHQTVIITGQVSNFQLATTRDGKPAYGFLIRDQAGTVKVVALGQADIREGDLVIVEGIFSRMRQSGRAIVYNEIKATGVRSMNRLNPDFVG